MSGLNMAMTIAEMAPTKAEATPVAAEMASLAPSPTTRTSPTTQQQQQRPRPSTSSPVSSPAKRPMNSPSRSPNKSPKTSSSNNGINKSSNDIVDDSSNTPDLNSLSTKAEVDALLKKKRKIREPRACYPCRQRKVKCDSQTPCKTCRDRGHPNVCSFVPSNKRLDANGIKMEEVYSVSISGDDWERLASKLNFMERSIADLKEEMTRLVQPAPFQGQQTENRYSSQYNRADTPDTLVSHPYSHSTRKDSMNEGPRSAAELHNYGPKFVKAMELNEQSHLTGETVHLGGGSVPALVMALQNGSISSMGSQAIKDVFGHGVLPLFGLDNENATYPFVSLWGSTQGTSARIIELGKAIPSDAECLELFQNYKDGAYMTYPAVVEVEQVESELLGFLANRRSGTSPDELPGGATSPGVDSMFGKSIQFAALLYASFASGAQFSDKPRGDRDLISQVYVCCSFECLRLVNYLSNVSLEVIQTLLVLGNVLSNAMNPGASWALLGMTLRLALALGLHRSSDVVNPTPHDLARAKTWWAVLWQDSLLSQSFDRPTTFATDFIYPQRTTLESDGFSFRETMYRIRKVGLDTVQNRVAPQSVESRLERCVELRTEIQEAYSQSARHLRDVKACRTVANESEYWQLKLHISYMNSELCRPAISPSMAEYDRTGELRGRCISELMNVVEAYLGLSKASPVHIRSWAITHRGLSSALLLGLLGEASRNEKARSLLREMRRVILESGQFSMRDDSLSEPELSAPIQRSVTALHRLTDPGTNTPKVAHHLNHNNGHNGTNGNNRNGNGTIDHDMENSSSYGPSDVGAPHHPHHQQQQQQQQPHMLNTSPPMAGPSRMPSSSAVFTESGLPNVMMNFEDVNFYLPSPLNGSLLDETSPHALMNSIIFGGDSVGL